MADGRVINVVEAVAAISFVGMKREKKRRKEGRKKQKKRASPSTIIYHIYKYSPLFHVFVFVVVVENVAALDLNGKRKEV